jgi:hypothetical protein
MKNRFYNLIVAFACCIGTVFSQSAFGQSFGYVAMGGGGYVVSIIPGEAEMFYAKTDVGGYFRWDPTTESWIPLFDWIAPGQTSYLGTESVAVDPQNPQNVYALGGTNYWNGGATAILRSSDYGQTMQITDVTAQFKANGNGGNRQRGEVLAVDPNKGNILFCGSRYNKGLFKSTDSGKTWSSVTSFNTVARYDTAVFNSTSSAVSFVIFDPTSATPGNTTQTIYVGIFRRGPNLYVSKDGGETWAVVPGGPTDNILNRAVLSTNGYLHISTSGSIHRLNTRTGVWANISPKGKDVYAGIDVDKSNPMKIVVSTYGSFNSQSPWGWGEYIFYSSDGGLSWVNKTFKTNCNFDANGITWMNNHSIHWVSSLTMDPFNTKRVWAGSGNGVFMCEDITLAKPTWKCMSKGLEETVGFPRGILSVPGGPLITSVGDQGGFVHTDVTVAPASTIPISISIAYAAKYPQVIIRSLDADSTIYISSNNGKNWRSLKRPPEGMRKGVAAISCDSSTIVWRGELNQQKGVFKTYRTTNQGETWTLCNNTPFEDPIADPVNPNVFYGYYNKDGKIYRSTDGGLNFTAVSTPGINGKPSFDMAEGYEGHIWLAMGSYGSVKYSTDGGLTMKNSTAYKAHAISLGKAKPGNDYPTIYIYGQPTSASVEGIHYSTDRGVTWKRADNDDHEYGQLANGGWIEADKNIYGRVYRSTAGMGIPIIDAETYLFLSPKARTVAIDSTTTLAPILSPDLKKSTGTIAWSIANPAIANVDNNGVVTGKTAGKTTVYARIATPSGLSERVDSCVINVKVSTGIERVSATDKSRLYPNPFSRTINLQYSGQPIAIRVINQQGITVKQFTESQLQTGSLQFGEELSPGIYFVQITGKEKITTHTIIKK